MRYLHSVAAGVLIEHGQNLGHDLLVAATCGLQKRSLLGCGQVDRIVK
jgi:hypothetical protein